MTFGVKETLCTSCVHCEVCSKKGEYLEAQSAVDNTQVYLEERSSYYLRDIKWIRPVQLQCTYYMSNGYGTIRGITVTECLDTASEYLNADKIACATVGGPTIAR